MSTDTPNKITIKLSRETVIRLLERSDIDPTTITSSDDLMATLSRIARHNLMAHAAELAASTEKTK